ncbi:glycosyltransferase [Schleiferilactobacillus perolens]|uniref:Glycosyltransferase n=1 Tax=Schleiferilactobacillus perolens DSM 12744 TaxID=1423792 RepID=A0A0R1N8U5_9LACO|nr:glycosyltransferase family 2 protein [Schleiferilactobacillus perolens]KRL14772.1 glycosyltransferase [Schleiferilactobacillus perolens DSM 12744]
MLLTWIITISLITYLIYLVNFALSASIHLPTIQPVDKLDQFTFCLVIPVLNEQQVIGETIRQLLTEMKKMPPQVKSQLIAVNDDSADSSRAIIEQLQRQYPNLILLNREPKDAHRGKGAVLNAAVASIHQHTEIDPAHTILGILDADSIIQAADLTKVFTYFTTHPAVDMLQGSVKIYNNDHWLTQMQDFEFMGINSALQQVRQTYGQGIASGNGQFMRLPMALANPWGHGLLEDLEFTLKAWTKGFTTAFSDDIVVYQSGIEKVRPLIRQRVRWCQGSMQCWRYLPAIWISSHTNFFQKLDTTLWLVLPVLSTFIPIANVVALVLQVYNFLHSPAGWISPALIMILALSLIICLAVGLEYHENIAKIKPATYPQAIGLSILYQAYLVLLIPVPCIALGRQLLHMTKWEKTEHTQSPATEQSDTAKSPTARHTSVEK